LPVVVATPLELASPRLLAPKAVALFAGTVLAPKAVALFAGAVVTGAFTPSAARVCVGRAE